MATPILMFCVGATKAGTSWLHETLSAHPGCHLRSIKELHYFDALEDGTLDRQRQHMAKARQSMEARLETAPLNRLPELSARIADRADWLDVLDRGEDADAYLTYLCKGQGGATVVGDVTPAYALLPTARLRQMATLLPDVRFVYLLRDPVSRLWSHVRMMAARRSPKGMADADRSANILSRTLGGDEREIAVRCDYAGALKRLAAAVDPARLLVMFYEELFGGRGLRHLCDFLGLAPRDGDTARRVHAGTPLEMSAELRMRARNWLAPQYAYVNATLGPLPAAWQNNMVPPCGTAG